MEKISDHPVSLSVSLEGQQQVKRKEDILVRRKTNAFTLGTKEKITYFSLIPKQFIIPTRKSLDMLAVDCICH